MSVATITGAERMMQLIFDLLMWPIEKIFYRAVSKDRQSDPDYKKNVQRLIERNREFEKRP
ncbi:hypothetical protein A4A58_28990 [Tardiphaga robiniae]|uniref:Uncharacterized protein n=1 Tax=Tardiphaga robiniae TaxID=943830 RepID=A0A163YWA8_9BRAD|nr:hypothetical protein A4A58_28990 [Tardiphaga robiniae]